MTSTTPKYQPDAVREMAHEQRGADLLARWQWRAGIRKVGWRWARDQRGTR